jgi:hypothetical protein
LLNFSLLLFTKECKGEERLFSVERASFLCYDTQELIAF